MQANSQVPRLGACWGTSQPPQPTTGRRGGRMVSAVLSSHKTCACAFNHEVVGATALGWSAVGRGSVASCSRPAHGGALGSREERVVKTYMGESAMILACRQCEFYGTVTGYTSTGQIVTSDY
eukprot:4570749-Prymnesium_polylepis.1